VPIISPVGGAGGGAITQVFNSLLSGSAASFDVTGISQLFSNLLIVGYLRGDTAAATTGAILRLNNDSAANYDEERVTGNAAAAGAAESLGGTGMTIAIIPANTATAGYFGAIFTIIPAYTNATGNKPVISPFWEASSNLTAVQFAGVAGGKWRTTATAVTRITVLPGAGNFVAGSQLSIYGLA
jgi:hypothetical protein